MTTRPVWDTSADRRIVTTPSGPGALSPTSYGDQDEAGVDLTLLRYLLQLTPIERLQAMEQHARDTLLLYEYGQRHRQAAAAARR